MPEKKNTGKLGHARKATAPMNGALKYFLGGCLAEFYLLLVRRYYVNGTAEQLVAWDPILQKLVYVGLALLAAGVILTVLWRKTADWKRSTAQVLLLSGAFLAAGNWVIRMVYPNGSMILCVLVPAVMLLGVLWSLYARECFYALSVLCSGSLVVWICRHGAESSLWRLRVMVGAAIYLALLAATAYLTHRAERSKGLVGSFRFLPADADHLVIYIACGLSASATVVSLISASIAYYALWVLGLVIFALAVYYTVREL